MDNHQSNGRNDSDQNGSVDIITTETFSLKNNVSRVFVSWEVASQTHDVESNALDTNSSSDHFLDSSRASVLKFLVNRQELKLASVSKEADSWSSKNFLNVPIEPNQSFRAVICLNIRRKLDKHDQHSVNERANHNETDVSEAV